MFNKVVSVFTFLLAMGLTSQAYAGGSVWDKIQQKFAGPLKIKVYHSPSCGCCEDWIEHLQKHSFEVDAIKLENVDAIKQKFNLPQEVASCHTAVIDGYIIEGHVPADDIKRLLIKRPNVRGLSVPKMPHGTPGMEMSGRKDPFAVVSFDEKGNYDAFNQYWSY